MKRLMLGCLMTVVTVCAMPQAASVGQAIAVVHSASGSECRGVVRFAQSTGGVKVVADLEGLAPNSTHGFHIHEFGDCSAPDATSAGSHYDPAGTKHHGKPEDAVRHTGDMGNIQADSAGKAHLELLLTGASISGADAPVLGRSIIVHANPDDFTQPVGNAGGRIGCGVIGIMKPAAK